MKKKITNWGNYPLIEGYLKYFTQVSELRYKLSDVNNSIARGMGRCYGDAALSSTMFSTIFFNSILNFDDNKGVIDVESGLTLDSILDFIVPKGWFLPVTPGTKYVTVGGAVASDVHGKNHHSEGCFRKHLIEIDVMIYNGEILTCSPSQNSDLFDSTTGGMGLTGIITRVKFKLKKIETSYIKQKLIKAKNLSEVLELFNNFDQYTYSVAWIDCLKSGTGFGRSILMLGEHAKKNELPPSLRKEPLKIPQKKTWVLPFFFPSFFLNRVTVSIFNFLFYNKIRKKVIENIVSYETFFYPLDFIKHWNRGYGKKGFLQYQFVLPLEAREGLVEILHKINNNGNASFLAVLKVFGEDESLISFPMKGYTLALDIPLHHNLFSFLDELDQLVLRFGGRIYLSKDARMKSQVFFKGYPHSEKFISIINKINPGNFNSLLSNRLQIKFPCQ
uniref:FAD-binding protein n=1 Tax=Algoriphagus sp. TaxID=1872435 RepID=UPI004047D936